MLSMVRPPPSGDYFSEAVAENLACFLGAQLLQANKWNIFRLKLLVNFDPGLRSLILVMTRSFVENARLFASPQLPPPPPLLIARHWGKQGAANIPAHLWQKVASFLSARETSWWTQATHPMIYMRKCGGIQWVTPPGCVLREHAPRDFLNSLMMLHGVKVNKCWKQASFEEIKELLGSLCGAQVEWHQSLGIEKAIQAIGVFLRLAAGVPVLLAGDVSAGADVELCKLIGEIMRGSAAPGVVIQELDIATATYEEVDALLAAPQPGIGSDVAAAAGPPGRRILLLRDHTGDTLRAQRPQALLERALLTYAWGSVGEDSKSFTLVVGAMHYEELDWLSLQMKLPRKLREVVVPLSVGGLPG